MKPRLHSPSPPRRSPAPGRSPRTWGQWRTPGPARDAGPRAKRWDEARQSQSREPIATQPEHAEPSLPGGGRACRGRGERKRPVASPGRRAQGTWSERGKGWGRKTLHGNGLMAVAGGTVRWAGGQACSRPVSERVTAPRAVWPEGQRTKAKESDPTLTNPYPSLWRNTGHALWESRPPSFGLMRSVRFGKSPSTAQPGMPQAAQRPAAAPARPATPRVRARMG